MKLFAPAVALLLVFGAAMALPGPTAQAYGPPKPTYFASHFVQPVQPATSFTLPSSTTCKTLTTVSERYNLYTSSFVSSYSVGLSWTDNGTILSRQVYRVEKIVNGGTPVIIQESTSKSFTDSGQTALPDDTVYRISTVGCVTAGVVFSYDAPNQPASGLLYGNRRIF
jgi:hypothetical protein